MHSGRAASAARIRRRAAGGAALLALASAAVGQTPPPLPRAERLAGEFACTACHAASPSIVARLASAEAPRLAQAGTRLAPAYLRRFLADPFGTKPGNRMPDVLGSVPEEQRAATVEGLVHFLASLRGSGAERSLAPDEREPEPVTLAGLERGRALYHQRGCVACHLPQEEPWELELPLPEAQAERARAAREPAPDAGQRAEPYLPPGTLPHPALDLDPAWLAAKTGARSWARFLLDPLATRPAGRMPDCRLSADEARDLARYLVREQVDWEQLERVPGVSYAYYEASLDAARPDFDALAPIASGWMRELALEPRSRDEHFAFRYSARLALPAAGAWTFHLTSDDGSGLALDGREVVDNGGEHAPQTRSATVELARGEHDLALWMVEVEGGETLRLEWEGPDTPRADVPPDALFTWAPTLREPEHLDVDARLAAAGAESFVALGCGTCHDTGDAELDARAAGPFPGAPALDALDPAGPGCLSDAPDGRRARFALDGDDAGALRALVAAPARLDRPLERSDALARALDRLRCLACHARDGLGGVHPSVRAYFVASDPDAELGDEGRFPPRLSRAGAKLVPAALEAALREGARVRPYLAARMPRFAEADVARLLVELPAVDGGFPELEARGDLQALRDGQVLAGSGGLGCIQCHTFGGRPSLGIQAIDLSTMAGRLRSGWFRELLLDPIALDMNTRMPVFWQDGRSPADVLGRDPERQVAALWSYLAQGEAMPFPPGLVTGDAAYELTPEDEPIACGVFFRDVSPRTLVVGDPELVHYAFDMQSPRLALAWRGRFFNARGTWEGRAGELEWAPSSDALAFPPGPPFAWRADPAEPWPSEGDARWLGRRAAEDGRWVMRYSVAGVEVEETLRPLAGGARPGLERAFVVHCDALPGNTTGEASGELWLRAFRWPPASGAPSGGELALRPQVSVRARGAGEPLRLAGDGIELRVPVPLARRAGGTTGYDARFALEVRW